MQAEPVEKLKILSLDAETIRKVSLSYSKFAFTNILSGYLKKKGMPQIELGRLLGLSHQAVSKWCSGSSRPQNKETAKEIGLALGLTEDEMNELLLSLGYMRLYPKNPLDSICIFVLENRKKTGDLLKEYRGLIERYKVSNIELLKQRKTIPTMELRKTLGRLLTEEELDMWLKQNIIHFSALGDTLLPKMELQMYVKLLLGGDSINRQYQNDLIPKVIRDWLYPMICGEKLTQKELRDKLIAFALFKNMAEFDINFMLDLAGLRSFSSPENTYETILLAAVRLAHERFPPYEDDCLGCVIYPEIETILEYFSQKEEAFLTEQELRQKTFYKAMEDEILKRIDVTWNNAEKYRMSPRDQTEEIFEKYYTDRNLDYSRCLAVYVRDITDVFIKEGIVDPKEAASFRSLLQLNEEEH